MELVAKLPFEWGCWMMGNHNLFWEDRLKWGEYFVTNKVMKISEALGGRLPLGWCRFIKGYIEGDFDIKLWFRLISPKGASCDFLAVFTSTASLYFHRFGGSIFKNIKQSPVCPLNCFSDSSKNDSCACMESNHKDRAPMFIIVPKAIEKPERMRLWFVPSLVRLVGLETFDDVYSRLRKTIVRFLPSFELGASRKDGKVQMCQFCLGAARKASKLPNKIVQNGAEIVDAVSDTEGQIRWQLFPTLQLVPLDLIDSFIIYLGYHSIWPAFNKPSGLTLKILHVLPCSEKALMKLFKMCGHE